MERGEEHLSKGYKGTALKLACREVSEKPLSKTQLAPNQIKTTDPATSLVS